MATKIKLARVGAPHRAFYRVVVSDSRFATDSKIVEIIGHWNPVSDPDELVIDREKAIDWLKKGAMPTESVLNLLKRAKIWDEFLKLKGGK
ncbi:MAG: 30S ribosomal protein S16 [Caldisericaceae bacterium]